MWRNIRDVKEVAGNSWNNIQCKNIDVATTYETLRGINEESGCDEKNILEEVMLTKFTLEERLRDTSQQWQHKGKNVRNDPKLERSMTKMEKMQQALFKSLLISLLQRNKPCNSCF